MLGKVQNLSETRAEFTYRGQTFFGKKKKGGEDFISSIKRGASFYFTVKKGGQLFFVKKKRGAGGFF